MENVKQEQKPNIETGGEANPVHPTLTQTPVLAVGLPSNDTPITIESLSATYTQNADANSDEIQALEISTSDVGGGVYYVIKTERWAFDNLDELIYVLKDFQNRLLAYR